MNVECFVGEIRMVAATYCPLGWAYCNGQLMTIADYKELFSLIGTTYGGDGRVDFALPDYRGRIIAGFGQGPGLTPRALGAKYGTETVALNENQMPIHAHPMAATTQSARAVAPNQGILADPGYGAVMYEAESTSDELRALAAESVAPTGQGHAHYNMMPYNVVSYIIALKGTYPDRS